MKKSIFLLLSVACVTPLFSESVKDDTSAKSSRDEKVCDIWVDIEVTAVTNDKEEIVIEGLTVRADMLHYPIEKYGKENVRIIKYRGTPEIFKELQPKE